MGESRWDQLACALFAGLTALVLVTFDDYGINSDEIAHFTNGATVLDYYSILLHEGPGERARQYHSASMYFGGDLYRYGALVDAVTTATSRLLRADPIATAHLVDALIGVLGIVGCWKLARQIAGPKAGFFAAAMLALVPAYYGHMFNNPKDVPFAAAYVWALYYIAVVLESARPRSMLLLKLGLAMGAAMGVRVGGLILPTYLVALLVGKHVWTSNRGRWRRAAVELSRDLVVVAGPPVAVAYVVMTVSWPWIHPDPILRPLAALEDLTVRYLGEITILFDGALYTPKSLPRTYVAKHLVVQLPEPVLVLLLLSPVLFFVHRGRRLAVALVATAAVFPVLYAAIRHAPAYNGFRHFLFVVPPLVTVAAVTLASLHDTVRRRHPTAAGVLLAFVSLLAAWTAGEMWRLHPYQYLFYNQLVGGTHGAAGRYELDYYCHSYAEAVRELDARLRKAHGPRYADMSVRVFTDDNPFSSTPWFPPNWTHVARADDADYVISKKPAESGEVLFTIERDGVTLNFVRARGPEARS